ncbi:MAG: UDP-N-acetylmuramate--alanine ligase [Betaproteobacteria bacterium]
MSTTPLPRDDLKTEVAATAARLIAEEGADYATAKRKAWEFLAGGARAALPDNAQVEAELRRYLVAFVPDHRQRLGELRARALRWMRRLAQCEPHLVGAVLNGTAGEHSDLHLHLFADSAKDVEMLLLDAGIDFEAEEGGGGNAGAAEETIHLLDRPRGGDPVGVVLDIHTRDAIRVAPRYRSAHPDLHPVEASGRAGIAQVERLLRDCHPEVAA